MKLALLVLTGMVMAGCTTSPAPWWRAIETATNTKCLEIVKRMTCKDFLKTNQHIRSWLGSQMAEKPSEPLNDVLNEMVAVIDRDEQILSAVPECQVHP